MATKKNTSARSALWVTSFPHDGPTSLMLTSRPPERSRSLAVTSARLRSAEARDDALLPSVMWACTRRVSLPRIWILASARPSGRSASRVLDTDTWRAFTSHEVPPLKSMPWLRPRVKRETTPARMTTADSRNQRRLLPMKS